MEPSSPQRMTVVKKIEDGMDRREITATTYQMRNLFRQFGDGVASELDVHCYLQHSQAATFALEGARVLDVCCGRGLMIPFLRYGGNVPSLYVGVDIHPTNAVWRMVSQGGKELDPRRGGQVVKDDWGFPRVFVESNVDSMAVAIESVLTEAIPDGESPFDLVVYTSAIEHMQPASQEASLAEARRVSREGTILYLTCPVTEQGRSGYDAQFAAHVYEPTMVELRQWLTAGGWRISRTEGLCTKTGEFRSRLSGRSLRMAESFYSRLPREFALPLIAFMFPECATEVSLLCVAVK